jgi:hypothetical protein
MKWYRCTLDVTKTISLGNLLHLISDDITNHLLSAYMYTCTESEFETQLLVNSTL